MLDEIKAELNRVIGSAGVDVCLEEHADLGTAVRVETADDVHHVSPEQFLALLKRMPDRAGVLALREELDAQNPPE